MKKQKRQMRLKSIVISLAMLTSFSARSQNEDIVIDKIIAKVDDYIILKSELERSYLDFLSRGQMRGSNAKCQILQQLVVNKMLMAQSEIDSIFVLDAEVNSNLDRRMNIMSQQFGGEEAIEKAYNKSMEQIRAEIFDNIKEQLTIQRMQSELTSNLKVTPSEVKKFFKQ
ncbi:MAG: peptidylprolyl isomerase, partial [Bacteroidota bacterium]